MPPALSNVLPIYLVNITFNLAELVSKTHPSEDGTPARLEIQITAHNPLDDHGLVIHEKFNQLCTELNAQGTISIVNSLMMKQ